MLCLDFAQHDTVENETFNIRNVTLREVEAFCKVIDYQLFAWKLNKVLIKTKPFQRFWILKGFSWD